MMKHPEPVLSLSSSGRGGAKMSYARDERGANEWMARGGAGGVCAARVMLHPNSGTIGRHGYRRVSPRFADRCGGVLTGGGEQRLHSYI